jgi:hypothetical protein
MLDKDATVVKLWQYSCNVLQIFDFSMVKDLMQRLQLRGGDDDE